MKYYLVSVKSIPNFIQLIEDPEVLGNLKTSNDDEIEFIKNLLKKKKKSFQINKITIYNNYKDWNKIAEENKKDENEFIIVEKDFIELINNNTKDNITKKNVTLNIKQMQIQFLSFILNIKKKYRNL